MTMPTAMQRSASRSGGFGTRHLLRAKNAVASAYARAFESDEGVWLVLIPLTVGLCLFIFGGLG